MPDMVCPYCGKPVTAQAAAAGRCAACRADIAWRVRANASREISAGAERPADQPSSVGNARWQDAWWNYCLWGLLFPAIGILLYLYFDNLEKSPDGTRWVWKPIAMLYAVGGKWIFPILFSLFGALPFFAGIRRLRRTR